MSDSDWLPKVVNITLVPREDGGLRICSEDVPGLVLSGKDPRAVLGDVYPALRILLALSATNSETSDQLKR